MSRRTTLLVALAVALAGLAVALGVAVVDDFQPTTGGSAPGPGVVPVPCVVAITVEDSEVGGGGSYHVATVAPDGTITRVSGPDVANDPDISPDGTRIAYVHAIGDYESAGPDRTEVWTTGIDGSDPTPVAADGIYQEAPAWSPDGARIALLRTVEPGEPELVVVPAGGGSATVVTDPTTAADPYGLVRSIDWSPDGERLAYLWQSTSVDEPWPTEVRTVGLDGSDPTVVAEVAEGRSVDWSPDGSSLLVTGNDGTTARMLLVDVASGAVQELPYPAALARWTADGARAYAVMATDDDPDEWVLAEVAVPGTEGDEPRPVATVGHPSFGMAVSPGC